jgi:hypothetical protein
MKRLILLGLSLLIFSCSGNDKNSIKTPLTISAKKELIKELKQMLKNDKRYRSFIAVGTSNQNLIDSIKRLPILDQINFENSHISEFTKVQVDSLWDLQNKIDLKNTNRLFAIINEYGWINKTQLDSVVDPMIFLFHTPKKTINKMQTILLKEVQQKRMEPKKFATYVDNMRKKAFGKNQLYGTGDEFDSKTNSIAPPFISNIDSTNSERLKIGLPILQEGEYRTSK